MKNNKTLVSPLKASSLYGLISKDTLLYGPHVPEDLYTNFEEAVAVSNRINSTSNLNGSARVEPVLLEDIIYEIRAAAANPLD